MELELKDRSGLMLLDKQPETRFKAELLDLLPSVNGKVTSETLDTHKNQNRYVLLCQKNLFTLRKKKSQVKNMKHCPSPKGNV